MQGYPITSGNPAFYSVNFRKLFAVNFFYIFSGLFLLVCSFIGYRTGFIRCIFFLLRSATALVAAYFLYPIPARLIATYLNIVNRWSNFIAFIFIFLFLHLILYFLFRSLVPAAHTVHRNLLNRIGGAFAAITVSLSIIIITARITYLFEVPAVLNSTIEQTGLADIIDSSAGWIYKSTTVMNENQEPLVMGKDTNAYVSHEAVMLPFATDQFTEQPELEIEMLQLVNLERQEAGLKPLLPDTSLTKLATAYSATMLKRGFFSHITPEGMTPFQRLRRAKINYGFAGENLALAFSLAKADEELMRSPGHRANILNTKYRKIGIGILDAGIHGLMITQEFKD